VNAVEIFPLFDVFFFLVYQLMLDMWNFLLVSQEVTFKVDYAVPSIGREFGSVFLGGKNVALLVVSEGWAKVDFFFDRLP
jgi:hypothetical protein